MKIGKLQYQALDGKIWYLKKGEDEWRGAGPAGQER